jgi:hypothetical protein
MSFALRAPSLAWEPVPLPTTPPVAVWGWFKPEQAPGSVVLQLPPALWQAGSPAITVRLLTAATGVESLMAATIYGQHVPIDTETVGLVDLPLPPPDGDDQQVILWAGAAAGVPSPIPSASATVGDLLPGENPAPYFELIEFYWTNILYIESEVRRARQQLDSSLSKLNSLNRDLTFEELYAADSADKQQWQDARRWLRDASASLSRSIKEIDVGLLSSAGQRNRFLDMYEQFVQPRIVFPGLKQAAVDFEMHHKSAKNVLQAAQTALHKGTSDGERRANAVLQRIHQKARQKSHQMRGKNA